MNEAVAELSVIARLARAACRLLCRFTMTGSNDLPGLTPRAVHELFNVIPTMKNTTVRVRSYFIELYNDNLVDLYHGLEAQSATGAPAPLEIKLDAKKMVFVRNSVVLDADSPEALLGLFERGNAKRHVGATKMNAGSSRSHSVFSILVEVRNDITRKTTVGKLSLVDLAGSERADKTGATGDTLREAQSINKSLSALVDVISALSTNAKFIPYRNNKLTQLMQVRDLYMPARMWNRLDEGHEQCPGRRVEFHGL